MSDMSEVQAKIKKLLALSQSPNVNEASLALERVHALLVKHNLEMSDIDTQDKALIEEVYEEAGRIRNYKKALLNQIATTNFCRLYQSKMRSYEKGKWVTNVKLVIVGRDHNVATTKAMADYLFSTIERMKKENAYGKGKQVVEAYCTGIADTLIVKLMAMVQEDSAVGSGTRDLVVSTSSEIDKFFKEKNMKSSRLNQNVSDRNAYAQGRQDGESIRLNRQVRGEASTTLRLS